jgi:beta-glucosidase
MFQRKSPQQVNNIFPFIVLILAFFGSGWLIFRSAQASGNLALNQPAFSSSFEDTPNCPACTADKAVDGNSGTRWGSQLRIEPEWIYVDLGLTTPIDRVVLNWEAAYAKEYEIQVSDDAANWTTVFATSNGDGGIDNITNLSATGRYVRMFCIKRAVKRFGFSLWEMEVYADSGATPTPTAIPPTPTPGGPTPTPGGTPIYLDPNAPIPDRVADLLSRMTLDEKIGQMTQIERSSLQNDQHIADYLLGSLLSGGGSAPNPNTPQSWADMVDGYQSIALTNRLGIPIIYGVDAVHGHNNVIGATIFPHNIGLGASRNPALVQEIGRITAKEVYATGIPWNFSPCLCVARDERWGRTYESFGEDPEIAQMMTTYVDGLQGTYAGGPGFGAANTVMATAKHWVADGGTAPGTGSGSYSLDQGDAIMSETELRAIHVPPYIDAINRNVGSVMPSYSSWNGQKMHGHAYLINDVLKTELGFSGFVISDWQAIDQLPGDYASDVRTAINAGVDMVMVPHDYQTFINTLRSEVQAGNVSMARIDEAVSRILTKKFELGLFEQPFADRTHIGEIGSAAHRDVARQAVRESLVLLKNSGATLPLDAAGSYSIVVAGKNAHDIGNQSGGWTISWQGSSGNITPGTTIFEGIQNAAGPGVTVEYRTNLNQPWSADVGIAVIGETPYAEGVGDDLDLTLSNSDVNAVNKVCQKATTCIVVLVAGRPLIINDQLAQADAFVMAWLPGTEGQGVADVLFGDYNFTGTLPMSWPVSVNDLPLNVGDATYNPLFPFGYGLTFP